MTIYLLAGHSILQNGAKGVAVNGRLHFQENLQSIIMRDEILKHLPKGVNVIVDTDTEQFPQMLRRLRREMSTEDFCLEIHFNAFYSPEVYGTEVFVKYDVGRDLKQIAEKICKITSEILDTKNRGVKIEKQSQHSSLALLRLPCRAILWELCFCSSPRDVASFYDNYQLLAKHIAQLISTIK